MGIISTNKTDVFTRTWGFVHFKKLNVNVEVFVMRKFLEWIKQEESGQGMVEYGIIVALVVGIAVIAFNSGLSDAISGMFNKLSTKIGNSITG